MALVDDVGPILCIIFIGIGFSLMIYTQYDANLHFHEKNVKFVIMDEKNSKAIDECQNIYYISSDMQLKVKYAILYNLSSKMKLRDCDDQIINITNLQSDITTCEMK
jgi:hypothetical protein